MKKRIVSCMSVFLCFSVLLIHPQLFMKKSRVPAAKIAESEASQLLILGTPHLRSYKEDFDPGVLEGLLKALENYHPDLIAIESASPLFVRDMFNAGDLNIEILKDIGGFRASEFGKSVREFLDVDWFGAKEMVEELLPKIETASEDSEFIKLRMELVLNFLAMNDMYSALLQWLYLPEDQRTDFDNLDKEILDYFAEHANSSNENVSIGIALAKKLNHQRIYAINDHRDKEDFFKVADKLSKMFGENEYLKTQPWKPLLNEITGRQDKAYEAGNLLPFYLWMNSDEYAQKDIDSQWQILFHANLPDKMAQIRLAFWDVRNFGIASNIRRATAMNPGNKMLVIIGASHKIFLDALFAESMDIKITHLKDFVPMN
jgi:hypothetical protein